MIIGIFLLAVCLMGLVLALLGTIFSKGKISDDAANGFWVVILVSLVFGGLGSCTLDNYFETTASPIERVIDENMAKSKG